MRISGKGTTTFLYINGLRVTRTLRLTDDVELRPAVCSPEPDDIIAVCRSETDIGVAALFPRHVGAQLCVTASDSKAITDLLEECYPSPEYKVLPITWTVHTAHGAASATVGAVDVKHARAATASDDPVAQRHMSPRPPLGRSGCSCP